jgi:myo-inositol-1(or 4)-monophosphatase
MIYNLAKKEKVDLAAKISKISISAGKLLTKEFGFDAGIKSSRKKDIKTMADMSANDFIVTELKKISHFGIVSEEDRKSHSYLHKSPNQPVWIIDPLDGTMNFTRSFPIYCVSMALWHESKPVLGVIYDVSRDIVYSGISGVSASSNGRVIRVSNITKIKDAIMATGFPSSGDYGTTSLLKFVKNIQNFKKIRMIGSAALSIAQVADGKFDIYYEKSINIWDVAAGLAIVEAAGGRTYHSEIDKYGRLDVIVWNGKFNIAGLL